MVQTWWSDDMVTYCQEKTVCCDGPSLNYHTNYIVQLLNIRPKHQTSSI